MRRLVASAALLLICSTPCVRALAADDTIALADLEARAEHAQAKEQCFLYTQLVHDYVEEAGRQIAAGDMEKATESLRRIETFASRIHMEKDTKRLKNAEALMHIATYHLGQFMRSVSSEDMALVQATLKRLDKLHDQLLEQVFAH